MDEQTGGSGGDSGSSRPGAPDPREELRDQLQAMGKAAGDLLEQLVKLPVTLAQIPMQALPEDTATHARNAATEGFAAVRTLLDSMAKGVDEVMKAQRDRMAQMGSTRTGVGTTPPPPPADPSAGESRDLDPGATSYLGGHGAGAGPQGTGSNGDGGNGDGSATTRLDSEP